MSETTKKILYAIGGFLGFALVGAVVWNTAARINSPTPLSSNDIKNFVTVEECKKQFVTLKDSGDKWAKQDKWNNDEPNRLEEYILAAAAKEEQTGSTPEPVATQTLRPRSNPPGTSVSDFTTPTTVSGPVVDPVATPPPTDSRSVSTPAAPATDTAPTPAPSNPSPRPGSLVESLNNEEIARVRRLINNDALRQSEEYRKTLAALEKNEKPNGSQRFTTHEEFQTLSEEVHTGFATLNERFDELLKKNTTPASSASTSSSSGTTTRGPYRGGAKRHY